MALRINFLPPNTIPKSQNFQPQLAKPKIQMLCTKNNLSDAELASDLATEVAKMNTHLVQKEEAMKKSKELLFTEFCQYLGLKEEDARKKWRKIKEEEKWDLVEGFVSEWSVNFHPLSARSVKELLQEYLHQVEEKPFTSSGNVFKRILGFSED
ncbi:uncharacterized protein LOC116143148 [Pistacia vera]|uniref:uncharacterized protein LOC116137403 n=1 Tax=Pistacia vera TaxID=55513 RepID=UPI001262BDAF|nr:uncharacterized protein LOC116137403 [Pistacia vera]XP_031284424.1 uncharacterized protein LOC116143148 [Pistacia vera]